jgi:hypothetical protein
VDGAYGSPSSPVVFDGAVATLPGVALSAGEDEALVFGVGAAAPNPVRAGAWMGLTLAAPAHVDVEVYDLLGRRVLVVLDDTRPAGRHRVRLDAGSLASGTYFVRVQATEPAGARHAHVQQIVRVD